MFKLLHFIPIHLRKTPAIPLVLLLSACVVGPDYQAPVMQLEPEYTHRNSINSSLAVPEADIQFWHNWDDPLLESLVETTLSSNHDIRIAMSRYEQARALTQQAGFDRYPTLAVSGEISKQRTSVAQAPGLSRSQRDGELHTAGLSAIWELDLFGRIRRSIESQQADAEAYAADLAGVQVAIVAEVVDAYFRLRGLQTQLQVARDNEINQADTLNLTTALFQEGRGTLFDTERTRAQLALTRSLIPPLQAEAAVTANRIAVLTGSEPAAMAKILDKPAALPTNPIIINTGVPSELLRRRPDVAAAERRLAAATARIGVATADLFPRFTLGGLIGTQALGFSTLFQRDSETRMVSLGIGGSFLDIGRVRSRIAAANAAAAENLAAYEQTVLLAIEETENALVQLSHAKAEQVILQQAAESSHHAAITARQQFKGGMIGILEVLDAERSKLEAEDLLAQSTTRQATALVAIYKTLAGGWPQLLPKPQGNAMAKQ